MVFLAVTAEEKGLLGSEYYASNPLYPLAKTVGVINMDALSAGGPARNFTISGSAKLDLLDQLISHRQAVGSGVFAGSETGSRPFLPLRSFSAGQARRAGHFLRFGR